MRFDQEKKSYVCTRQEFEDMILARPDATAGFDVKDEATGETYAKKGQPLIDCDFTKGIVETDKEARREKRATALKRSSVDRDERAAELEYKREQKARAKLEKMVEAFADDFASDIGSFLSTDGADLEDAATDVAQSISQDSAISFEMGVDALEIEKLRVAAHMSHQALQDWVRDIVYDACDRAVKKLKL